MALSGQDLTNLLWTNFELQSSPPAYVENANPRNIAGVRALLMGSDTSDALTLRTEGVYFPANTPTTNGHGTYALALYAQQLKSPETFVLDKILQLRNSDVAQYQRLLTDPVFSAMASSLPTESTKIDRLTEMIAYVYQSAAWFAAIEMAGAKQVENCRADIRRLHAERPEEFETISDFQDLAFLSKHAGASLQEAIYPVSWSERLINLADKAHFEPNNVVPGLVVIMQDSVDARESFVLVRDAVREFTETVRKKDLLRAEFPTASETNL